jgi:GNAT superfamily N-acetyltransferase
MRTARRGDYDALVGLFDELDELHRQARPDVFQRFGLAVLLARPPAAFAGAVPHKVIELDNLVVRADRRGQRIGRQLLEATLEWSRGQGASHIAVAVHAFNRDARRFYEDFGFAPSIDRLILAA